MGTAIFLVILGAILGIVAFFAIKNVVGISKEHKEDQAKRTPEEIQKEKEEKAAKRKEKLGKIPDIVMKVLYYGVVLVSVVLIRLWFQTKEVAYIRAFWIIAIPLILIGAIGKIIKGKE